jgi:hypothetical protein
MVTYALLGDNVAVSNQSQPAITVYGPNGLVARLVRWSSPDLTITQADLKDFIDFQSEIIGADSTQRAAFASRTMSMPLPPSQPAHGRILSDSESLLWVSEAHFPNESPRRWSVVDPEAGVLAVVHTPERLNVLEVGEDYLLGRYTDSLGVEYVHLYGLARR